MSSRAAAGRKRLTGGDKDDKRSPSSPKGFLSRFRSAKAVSPRIDHSLHSDGPQIVSDDSAYTTPNRSQVSFDVETPQTKRNSFNNIVSHNHLDQVIHIISNPPSEESHYTAGTYIEASYQPPPPILASYQPPPAPPSHPTRNQGRRPLPVVPLAVIQSSSSVETISEIPAPPSYASPVPRPLALPSSSTNSTKPSFLLQSSSSSSTRSNSPTPTYSSIPIPHSVHALPRLQVPNPDLSRKDKTYNQYNYGSPSYPTSSSSSSPPIILTYSPLAQSTQSTSPDDYNERYWNHGGIGSRTSRLSAPQRPSSVGSGPPKSTSGSSGSSRRSISADLAQNAVLPRLAIPNGASTLSNDSLPSTKSSVGSAKGNGGGSDHSAVPPSGYVFPVGRSRAQPSKSSTVARNRSDKGKASEIVGEGGGKGRNFLGISLKKKKLKPIVEPQSESTTIYPKTEVIEQEIHDDSQLPSMREEVPDSEESSDVSHEESQEWVHPTKSRVRTHPFDPYNPILLESDFHTAKLLRRANPTNNPTFYDYGNTPPTSVLDLGCGQGHWIIDAAVAWKGYGTTVVGYDMVDISHGLVSRAIEQGVMENLSFVQGNFLEERLPFNDESFDLVRMSCLTLCITSELWTLVLQEVHRVLMTGGRLEMIDDALVFPYCSNPSLLSSSIVRPSFEPGPIVPQLNINIPSASLSRTSSIYYTATTKDARSVISADDIADQYVNDLGPVEEEPDVDDARTINGPDLDTGVGMNSYPSPRAPGSERYSGISSISWSNSVDSSKNLEGLFDHMLLHNFDIRTDSSEFIPPLIKEVFGYGREMFTMDLSATPQNAGADGSRVGLVLRPSTLLLMDRSEINIHASRYPRLLLSCKDVLVEHAMDIMDEDEIDEASVLEALRDYEDFLPYRLGFSHSPTFSRSRSGTQKSVNNRVVSEEVPFEFGAPLTTSFGPTSNNALLPYTSAELTHVRSFRIYEAIKVDITLFSTSST